MDDDEELTVGAVARLAGTTIRAVRYYEEVRILEPERTAGGHRRYSAHDVGRLRQALSLRSLEIPLDRIREILADRSLNSLHAVLIEQRGAIVDRIDDLTDVLSRLDEMDSDASPPHPGTAAETDLLERIAMGLALTHIYTRSGDDGTTSLGSTDRVDKDDPRIEAIGAVDELSSTIGVAIASATREDIREVLWRVQNELFDLGADLAVPVDDAESTPTLRISAEYVTRLETDCDAFNADLPALRSFILPGTDAGAAALHVSRAVCRRAERRCWQMPGCRDEVRQYLNRLSDLLFILARSVDDVGRLWQPGAST